jgi:hypothetical protein
MLSAKSIFDASANEPVVGECGTGSIVNLAKDVRCFVGDTKAGIAIAQGVDRH